MCLLYLELSLWISAFLMNVYEIEGITGLNWTFISGILGHALIVCLKQHCLLLLQPVCLCEMPGKNQSLITGGLVTWRSLNNFPWPAALACCSASPSVPEKPCLFPELCPKLGSWFLTSHFTLLCCNKTLLFCASIWCGHHTLHKITQLNRG